VTKFLPQSHGSTLINDIISFQFLTLFLRVLRLTID